MSRHQGAHLVSRIRANATGLQLMFGVNLHGIPLRFSLHRCEALATTSMTPIPTTAGMPAGLGAASKLRPLWAIGRNMALSPTTVTNHRITQVHNVPGWVLLRRGGQK